MHRARPDTSWQRLTRAGDVRFLKYSWGPATANSLAVRVARGWLVVSAPITAEPAVFDELEREGGAVALLAPNAFHYLGQAAWRRRFPDATSWAPRTALARLARASPDIPYRPVDELGDTCGGHIENVEPRGQRQTDLLLRVDAGVDGERETVWWLGDLFSNTTADDQIWPLRVLSRVLGSGPGYRRNRHPGLVYVREPALWLDSVRAAVMAHPPTIVVPAHGDPVRADAAARTAALLVTRRDQPTSNE